MYIRVTISSDLTLTSVVFEFEATYSSRYHTEDLTLTSVVFELKINCEKIYEELLFNFNKCCIWITFVLDI